MRVRDHVELAVANLWKRKLRTLLTAFGVTIGIGALVAMVSFGKGMQKNVTESVRSLDDLPNSRCDNGSTPYTPELRYTRFR